MYLEIFGVNENCINATKWLLEQKLKNDITTAKYKLTKKHFKDNNLLGLYGKATLNHTI